MQNPKRYYDNRLLYSVPYTMFMGEDCKTIAHHVGSAKHYYYIGIPGSRMLLLIIVNFFMMGIDEVFNQWEHFSVCHNCLEFFVFMVLAILQNLSLTILRYFGCPLKTMYRNLAINTMHFWQLKFSKII